MLASGDRPVELVLDVDGRTIAVAAALTFAVTMLFGLAPAVRASATPPLLALKETRAPHTHRRLADGLVAAQMGVCVFLLVGASLFLGSFDRLQRRPLGFSAEHLVHLTVEGRVNRRPGEWADLAASLDALPGIESAAVAGWAPLTGNRWRSSVTVPGMPPRDSAPNWVAVSPGYFATMGTPILEGRDFHAGDRPPGAGVTPGKTLPGVAIVNQTFARVYFNGHSPVGQRVIVDSSGAAMEIVALTADAVYFNVRETPHPAVFVPMAAQPGATLLLRTTREGVDARRLRGEVSRLRPDVQVSDVAAFGAIVAQQTLRERLLAALSSFFAMLALLLAVIGMYGLLNHTVTREQREIGVRMALGARPRHLLTLVATRVLIMVGVGGLLGLAGGVAFGSVVRALLFEVAPTDPGAIVGSLIAMAAAAMIAVLPPAMRAIRIDPAQTIRTET
jgi:predicted permease